MTGNATPVAVELTAGNLDDTYEMYAELCGVRGITVTVVPAPMHPGVQGTPPDSLSVALSSGAVSAFPQIVKVLVESRGPKFCLKIRRGQDQLHVTLDNINAALPVIRSLLDDRS